MFTLLILILFTLGQIGRISFFNQEINIYLYETAMLVNLVWLSLHHGLVPFKKTGKFLLVYLFFAWLLLSLLLTFPNSSPYSTLIGLLYLGRLKLYLLWGIYWFYDMKKNKRNNYLSKSILVFVVFIIVFSTAQFLFYPDLTNLRYLGWDVHWNRLFGVFFDTSVAGAIFGLLFWLIFLLKDKILKNSVFRYFLLTSLLIMGILTFSRNFYISFLVTVFFYFIQQKQLKIALGMTFIFILIIIAVPKNFGKGVGLDRIFTISARLSDYRSAISIWKNNPIIGVGYNRIRYAKEQNKLIEKKPAYPVHSGASFSSSFSTILVSSGLVGLWLFLVSLIKISKINNYAMAGVVFAGFMSIGDNIILHPFVMFLMILGIGGFSLLSGK